MLARDQTPSARAPSSDRRLRAWWRVDGSGHVVQGADLLPESLKQLICVSDADDLSFAVVCEALCVASERGARAPECSDSAGGAAFECSAEGGVPIRGLSAYNEAVLIEYSVQEAVEGWVVRCELGIGISDADIEVIAVQLDEGGAGVGEWKCAGDLVYGANAFPL